MNIRLSLVVVVVVVGWPKKQFWRWWGGEGWHSKTVFYVSLYNVTTLYKYMNHCNKSVFNLMIVYKGYWYILFIPFKNLNKFHLYIFFPGTAIRFVGGGWSFMNCLFLCLSISNLVQWIGLCFPSTPTPPPLKSNGRPRWWHSYIHVVHVCKFQISRKGGCFQRFVKVLEIKKRGGGVYSANSLKLRKWVLFYMLFS